MAPSKPPSPSAALFRKPAFMEHNAAALKTVGLLAACPAPWKDETTGSANSPLNSEDAMGLSKWIITAAELTASGLSTSSAITKFKIRGRLSTATQSFTNFEAGLKRVTYTTPGCGGIGNAAGDCGSSSMPSAAQFISRDADKFASPGAFTLTTSPGGTSAASPTWSSCSKKRPTSTLTSPAGTSAASPTW